MVYDTLYARLSRGRERASPDVQLALQAALRA